MALQGLPNTLSNHLANRAVCRFAPTCSGSAHPGTLLAAMLAYLDAKKNDARFVLRMEDIDPSSVTDHWRSTLLKDLEWFDIKGDCFSWQSENTSAHESMMDQLALTQRLYACNCSRAKIARAGQASLAGGWVYPGTCRSLTLQDWRSSNANIRINLEGIKISLKDQSGADLSQEPSIAMGDPLLVRKDGSFTYHLAVVADDHLAGVNRIVRGRDLASSSAIQVALRQLLGWPVPSYRHHLLLLEERGQKFAKFHGAVCLTDLQKHYSPDQLRGVLAHACGLIGQARELSFHAALSVFDWQSVRSDDLVMHWDGKRLSF